MARENAVCSIDVNGSVITANVVGAGAVVVDMDKVHADVKREAMMYGMSVRLSRATALERDRETGRSATPADKFARVKALADHYNGGAAEWNLRGGGERAVGGFLVQALIELHPESTPEKVRAFVKTLKPAERAAIEQSDRVKPVIDRIAAEATAGVDVEGLLAGL